MKKLTAFVPAVLFCLLISFPASAQFRLPGSSNGDVRQALERVITDFPKNFSNLKAEVLNNDLQSVQYASHLQFKTAENNTITEYSGKQPVYSWQAQMFTVEEFPEAEKKYKSLYKDLKGMTLTLNRDYSYGLEGEYGTPNESLGFATTAFHLTPNASNLPKVKVELSLQYEFPEWKIYLSVFQKEREDNERGKVRE
jgi:hypothetical protein